VTLHARSRRSAAPGVVALLGLLALPLAASSSCGDDPSSSAGAAGGTTGAGANASGGQAPGGQGSLGGQGSVCTTCTPQGPRTFALPASAGLSLWTTTTMDKVLEDAAVPTTTGAAIQVRAAKNEFEPFQIVVRADVAGTATLSLGAFTNAAGQPLAASPELRRVGYVPIQTPSDASSLAAPGTRIPDPLLPASFGAAEPVAAGKNQPFWITLAVPKAAAAGDYTATLDVTVNGQKQSVPVALHVFDFALPDVVGFDGNWNASFQALGGSESLEAVRSLKDFFYDHRLVPSGVAWPAGLNYTGGIAYDCASGTFKEENNAYDFSQLGPTYIDGKGWNGVGFPSFEIMQFVDNSTPRPAEFCGVPRGESHRGTDAYNAAWSKLLAAIDAYLVSHGYQDKGYYYVQNEPQNDADHDTAAFLAALSKKAAPHLRLAVSEEPKPQIAENPLIGGARYDLWWANLSAFEPAYAEKRQAAGDTVWWYFLYGDAPPHFNPITIDHPGIESRIAHWAAWRYRVRGFAYYSVTGWGADPYTNTRPEGTKQNGDGYLLYPPKDGRLVTSIRWELLREGAEDYEYFLLASRAQKDVAVTAPRTPSEPAPVDTTVNSAVSSVTAYTRDASALQELRDQLGARIEGKVDGFPVLGSKLPGAHPREATYLNFQDPQGEPKAEPLVVDGHTWLKIGWDAYDATKGYGWAGENIGNKDIMLYQYQADAPGSVLDKSIVYDDYGRLDTFEWAIENGLYEVTVGIGWHDGTYPKNRVVIEGKLLYDNVATTPATPHLQKSVVVDVKDGSLTMEAGQKDEYTMLNWLSVVPK
jgi:hypothetical protein